MMSLKQVTAVSVALGLALLLPACWPTRKKEAEAAATQQLYVLNVLDAEQYNEAHIPGSVNVPFGKIEEWAQGVDRAAEVYVYCSNYQCTASSQAVKQLKELGFEKVAAYEGGIAEWVQQGLPVEGTYTPGACTSEYLTKVAERPAEVSAEIPVITADGLKEKLVASGLLKVEASAPAEQSAAA